MSEDIVARLRSTAHWWDSTSGDSMSRLLIEAADEIERLLDAQRPPPTG